MNRSILLLALCVLCSGPVTARAQQVMTTSVLAPLAGPDYTPARGQEGVQFYGTDLGYTFSHDGQLRILFGDTLPTAQPTFLFDDDAQGTLAFARCPGGRDVDRWVDSHPANPNAVWWKRVGPPLTFATTTPSDLSFIQLSLGGTPISMSILQTPIGAFSDGREHAFGLFNRTDFAICDAGNPASGCGGGLVCDTGVGACDNLAFAVPCILGAIAPAPGVCPEGSSCVATGGHCRDPESSIDDGTAIGRLLSVAQVIQVGVAEPDRAEHYRTTPWTTNKFLNLVVRTVNDFSALRPYGIGNDYSPADGVAVNREKVLIWGRPGFVGNQHDGRETQLYLAVADMPRVNDQGAPSWAPRYFAGSSARGIPVFTPNQVEAMPLDLSGGHRDPHESFDIADQMSVSWVEGLNKWVMLYGGDLDPLIAALYNPGSARDPDGAIQIRFADQPWGPWTKPQPLLRAGDPYLPLAEGTQYAEGGILFHPACLAPNCVPGDPPELQTRGIEPFGRLYGPNVIDCWTESRGPGQVDLYWNVSTWNPYQVVLVKTRLRRSAPRRP